MNLRCPYCSCRFSPHQKPLVFISCGHTFCEDCLRKIFETYNSFSCSKCEISTNNPKNFIFNRILMDHLENPQRIQSESNILGNSQNPPFFEIPEKAARFQPNWRLLEQPMMEPREGAIWLSTGRNRIFNEKKRSSNFVSHFATKAKIHRNKFFNKNQSKARSRTPVRNRHYRPENSPQNQKRSISKTKILPKQFTFEEHLPGPENRTSPWKMCNSRSKTNKVIVNPNFKSKKDKRFAQEKKQRRRNYGSKRHALKMEIGNGRSTPQKMAVLENQYLNIANGRNMRRGRETGKRSQKFESNWFSGDNKSASGDRNSSKQEFLSAQSLLRREFENMLDLKKPGSSQGDPLNKLEIDSLFDSNSNTLGGQMLKPCTLPQCSNRSTQNFCSIECFEQFQRLFSDKRGWSLEAAKENWRQQNLIQEKEGGWVERVTDPGKFLGGSFQRQFDALVLPKLENVDGAGGDGGSTGGTNGRSKGR